MKELKRFQLSTKVVVVLKGRLQVKNFGYKYMRERERVRERGKHEETS